MVTRERGQCPGFGSLGLGHLASRLAGGIKPPLEWVLAPFFFYFHLGIS